MEEGTGGAGPGRVAGTAHAADRGPAPEHHLQRAAETGRTLIIPAWCPPLPPRLPAIRTSHLLPAVFVRAALRRRRLRRRRRFQARVPSLLLGDMTCLDRFRLDRAAIQALCEELAPALQGQAAAPRGIPVLQRVLLSLRYLATGSFQGVMAEALEVSQSSASRCLHAFLDALVGRIREHIHFPTSEAELAPIRAGFSSFAGFPNVIGAVDCTHVAICAPREEPQVYRNRHRFYSINVQAACDHQGIFTDLVAKFPGSVHDAQIFTTSGLNRLLSSWPEGRGWLLGDRGYPLLPYLLTPYPADEPADRANYNQAHRRTRMVIERAFGPITCVCFSKDGQCTLAASLDSTLRLLDKDTGELLGEYTGHKNVAYKMDCCLSERDTHVGSCSEDGKVYFWDLVEGSLAASLPVSNSAVQSLSFHPTEACLLTAAEGLVQLWREESYVVEEGPPA